MIDPLQSKCHTNSIFDTFFVISNCLSSFNSRCRRKELCSPNDNRCLQEPYIYVYNYLTIPSNIQIPDTTEKFVLFTLKGPSDPEISQRFDMKLISAVPDSSAIEAARKEDFRLIKNPHGEAEISVSKPLKGPQTIQLQIEDEVYHNGELASKLVSIVFIHVSMYEY